MGPKKLFELKRIIYWIFRLGVFRIILISQNTRIHRLYFNVFPISQYALPHIRKTEGSVVNISSLADYLGCGATIYAATKVGYSSCPLNHWVIGLVVLSQNAVRKSIDLLLIAWKPCDFDYGVVFYCMLINCKFDVFEQSTSRASIILPRRFLNPY